MLLEFEKPIAKLEEQLASMKAQLAKAPKPALNRAVKKLAKEIEALQLATFRDLTRWQRVQLSRHSQRPHTLDYIHHITDSFVALHGDRTTGDDKAMVGGLGQVAGEPLMLIGHQKGRSAREQKQCNRGMPHPEGYRKALRLMKLAEKFDKPIVTLIDTPGPYPGLGAEERGQAQAIAHNIQAMFSLRVPVLCIVTGEGGAAGALGIGIGDSVLMLENTWYSVASPEDCSSLLWKSVDCKEQAAEALQLTAQDMLTHGLIDAIVPEPAGGAHKNPVGMAATVKHAILTQLKALRQHTPEERIQQRIERFCRIGHSHIARQGSGDESWS